MGLFDAFKKKKTVSFEEIDSIAKAQEECRKGKSIVPSKITIASGKDGVEVFKQTIEVW